MKSLFRKYTGLLTALLLLALLAIGWFAPSTGITLGLIFLLFSLVIASYSIFEKHRKAYLQGKISRNVFIRNIILEITGILLAMLLAALVGNHLAELSTRQLDNTLTKFIAGILIGLLVGLAVGFLVKRAWDAIQNRLLSMH